MLPYACWFMGIVALLVLCACAATGPQTPGAEKTLPRAYWVYLGTMGAKSEGIYLLRLDTASAALTPRGLAAREKDPNFLAVHPSGRILYAVARKAAAGPDGVLDAFGIDPATGLLTLLNQQPTGGADAVHVTLDPAARAAVVANYTGASVAAFPLAADGRVGPRSALIAHVGSSVNPVRQKRAYPHAFVIDPAGRFAWVPDLGADQIIGYRLDVAQATLTPHAVVKVAAGAGPRHLAFTPNGAFAYLVTEMGNTVIAYAYDASAGKLTELQTLSTLPPDFHGPNTGAEIAVHPTGHFVYVSNRGHDSIAVFRMAPDGRLTLVAHTPTGGQSPRSFALDPAGRFLVAANQQSGTVTLFALDPLTGTLTPRGEAIPVPGPVSVEFVPTK